MRVAAILIVSLIAGAGSAGAQSFPDERLPVCEEEPGCAYEERHYPLDAELLFTHVRRAIDRMSPVDLQVSEDSLRLSAAFRVFFFLDDLNVVLERFEAGTRLYIRSASRTGIWDAGTNRRRINGFFERLDGLLD